MSSTNQGPEYFAAEKKYLSAKGLDEKIYFLEEMIRNFKKHKGSEKMLAEIRTRLIKFKRKLVKSSKSGKGKKGIKKEGFQVALVGLTNSGKSCLLGKLTNAKPKVSDKMYITKEPEIGTLDFEGVKSQIIDFPAIEGKDIGYGILNTSDLLLIVVTDLDDVKKVEKYLGRSSGKRLIVVNKIDLLNSNENRKLKDRIKSKRIYGIMVSCNSGEGIQELKKKIFDEMEVIRVYTKEPGKKRTERPMVLKQGSSVKDVAEMIHKGFSRKVKEARLTGPSGKFSNQRVGLKHRLKDMDVLEFRD